MGIQRFGAHLKPYATKSILGSTTSPAQSTTAVIDGPGLAHHVYYGLCTKGVSSTENVSYAEIVQAVLEWLETLSRIGFSVHTILFDGALPDLKRDVRIDRLQNYVARIRAYKQSLGNELPLLTREGRRSLPPPPFLVFAVVEHLLQHAHYAETVCVVPGEADGFCVAAAQMLSQEAPERMIAIFSDDADLLVYELPSNVCVIPFRDLSESRTPAELTWRGDLYWSADIARRMPMSLDNLIKPAFFMSRDSYLDLVKACRLAAASDPAKHEEYPAFARLFEPTQEIIVWNNIMAGQHPEIYLGVPDSRVSELVSQLQQGETQGGVRMYLPLLLEDPARATAWNAGADLRMLAYSSVLQASSLERSVQEYRRSGARVASTLVDTISGAELNGQLIQLTAHVEQVLAWATDDVHINVDETWRYIVMQLTVQHLQVESRPLPSLDDVMLVVTGRHEITWRLIHLSAQYQAVYYSLRILRQILIHMSLKPQTGLQAEPVLARLHEQFASFPHISAFFIEPVYENGAPDEQRWRTILGDMLTTLGIKQPIQSQGKQKNKKTKEAKTVRGNAALADNPFAALAES